MAEQKKLTELDPLQEPLSITDSLYLVHNNESLRMEIPWLVRAAQSLLPEISVNTGNRTFTEDNAVNQIFTNPSPDNYTVQFDPVDQNFPIGLTLFNEKIGIGTDISMRVDINNPDQIGFAGGIALATSERTTQQIVDEFFNDPCDLINIFITPGVVLINSCVGGVRQVVQQPAPNPIDSEPLYIVLSGKVEEKVISVYQGQSTTPVVQSAALDLSAWPMAKAGMFLQSDPAEAANLSLTLDAQATANPIADPSIIPLATGQVFPQDKQGQLFRVVEDIPELGLKAQSLIRFLDQGDDFIAHKPESMKSSSTIRNASKVPGHLLNTALNFLFEKSMVPRTTINQNVNFVKFNAFNGDTSLSEPGIYLVDTTQQAFSIAFHGDQSDSEAPDGLYVFIDANSNFATQALSFQAFDGLTATGATNFSTDDQVVLVFKFGNQLFLKSM